MRAFIASLFSLVLIEAKCSAAVLVFNSSVGVDVPDSSSSGIANSINVPESETIHELMVSISLSVPDGQSGFLGDLYAYVQHGTMQSTLLNRPGKTPTKPAGYGDSVPVSVTFDDRGANGDIHNYRFALNGDNSTLLTMPLTGFWQPDARAVDPGVVTLTDPRTSTLSAFAGGNTSGEWSIYLADLSGGGVYRLESWSLIITTVPEPNSTTLVMALFTFTAALISRSKSVKPLLSNHPKSIRSTLP